MKTIGVIANKGGVGKTTICAALSVFAIIQGKKIYISDLDPQGSLAEWWNARDNEHVPEFLNLRSNEIALAQKSLRSKKADYFFIDTPPSHLQTIEEVCKNSDFVLIPCQPSPIDVKAIGETITIVEDHNKPFAFVINRVVSNTRLAQQALVLLSQHGKVANPVITQRIDFPNTMIDGGTVSDLSQNNKAYGEIKLLWEYVESQF